MSGLYANKLDIYVYNTLAVASFAYLSLQIFTPETNIERLERINRMADRECQNMESDEQARNCYDWYYSQIEDRY